MASQRTTPAFKGLKASSPRAAAAAKSASRKKDTRCEVALRGALAELGLHPSPYEGTLPGKPDLVFVDPQVAVFCDGDFWHGRNFVQRIEKLSVGHNAPYWIAKITRNVARDREQEVALSAQGWKVVRAWETDILKDPVAVGLRVAEAIGRCADTDSASPIENERYARSTQMNTKVELPVARTFQKAILEALADLGGEASNDQLAESVAKSMQLSLEQLHAAHSAERGTRTEFEYRMAWARTKLKADGLIAKAGFKQWRVVSAEGSAR